LAALALESKVGLFLGEAEVALQDAFSAFDQLASFELLGKMRVFTFQAGHFDFGADEEPDGGNELDLAFGVDVRLPVLQVDDADGTSSAKERDGKEGLVAVFREFVEELEARVLRGIAGDGYGFEVLGDPSGDALADLELEAVEDFGVRILRGAEDKFFAFQYIDKTGIALDQGGSELYDAVQDFVEWVGGGHAAAEFVKEIYLYVLTHQQRTHGPTVGPGERRVQSYFLMEKIKKTRCENVCQMRVWRVGYTAMKFSSDR